ncbi:MAG TPA: phage holin family protein, partial [Chitinophagaceae bacterium]|nr:phage holin family protein [Chitinophagaceae bacterium]
MIHFFKTSKLLWAGILLGIDLLAKPKAGLIAAVFILVLIDFITGITKAKLKGVARTSQGYRKTVIKLMQYVVAIIIFLGGGYFLKQAIPPNAEGQMLQVANILQQASSYVMLFVIYIEVSSIFENLYEIDSKSPFSRFFINPV